MQSDLHPGILYNLSIMASLLRVLMIEDVDSEAQQILLELRSGGYDVRYHCVGTRAAMQAALSHNVWDIIFCDDNLSSLSPIEALATLQESGRNLPFFLRAGISGKDTLVTILQSVARDFVVKESLVPLRSVLLP
jgi:CheY-like chemotaxis protein